MDAHDTFMRAALEQARQDFNAGEVPVGAVVSTCRAHELPPLNHRINVVGGVTDDGPASLTQRRPWGSVASPLSSVWQSVRLAHASPRVRMRA